MTTLAKPKFHDLTAHPLADIFPLMEGEDFDALVEDIRANGLREPITLYEDKILDGRNRYRAAVKAKMQYGLKEENFRTYQGSDPLGFVVSANLHRRHLTESQRALIAARLVTTKLGDNQFNKPGVTTKQAATMLGVSEATVKTAKDVAQKATPEIKEKVLKGELRLGAAKDVIKKPKEEQQAELARIVKEREEKQQAAQAERDAAKAAKEAAKATGKVVTPNQSKANQAMKDVDDFCKKWKAFDNNQRRAFVDIFKDELAALLDAIQQQKAMIGAAA
jgi:ParB-like chromosome segregation protein Spo0J